MPSTASSSPTCMSLSPLFVCVPFSILQIAYLPTAGNNRRGKFSASVRRKAVVAQIVLNTWPIIGFCTEQNFLRVLFCTWNQSCPAIWLNLDIEVHRSDEVSPFFILCAVPNMLWAMSLLLSIWNFACVCTASNLNVHRPILRACFCTWNQFSQAIWLNLDMWGASLRLCLSILSICKRLSVTIAPNMLWPRCLVWVWRTFPVLMYNGGFVHTASNINVHIPKYSRGFLLHGTNLAKQLGQFWICEVHRLD